MSVYVILSEQVSVSDVLLNDKKTSERPIGMLSEAWMALGWPLMPVKSYPHYQT